MMLIMFELLHNVFSPKLLQIIVFWEDPRIKFQQLQTNYIQNTIDESLVYTPNFTLSKEALFQERLAYENREISLRNLYAEKIADLGYVYDDSYEGE